MITDCMGYYEHITITQLPVQSLRMFESVTCFSAEQKDKDVHAAEVLHREVSFLPSDRPVEALITETLIN